MISIFTLSDDDGMDDENSRMISLSFLMKRQVTHLQAMNEFVFMHMNNTESDE